jgi:hypothetical protein
MNELGLERCVVFAFIVHHSYFIVLFSGAARVTQSVPSTAFIGDVPANLRCGFCGQPVQKQFYRALNRFTCSNCAQQVNTVIARNAVAPHTFAAAAGAGLITALAGAAVWAVIVHVTHMNIGYIALGIGYAVGKVVHFAAGKRRGVALQWLATILALIGVSAGKLGVVCWQIVDGFHANGVNPTVQDVIQIFQENRHLIFEPFDLVWMGLAAYAAWKLSKPQNISIAGPYAYQPKASALQFNTVEPLNVIPPATPKGNP